MKLLIIKLKGVVEVSERDLYMDHIRRGIKDGIMVVDESVDYDVVEFDSMTIDHSLEELEQAEAAIRNKRLNAMRRMKFNTKG